MNNAKIYLCKTDGTFLGCLSGLKTETCNFTKKATDYWELTFEVERYIDNNGSLAQSSYYDSIDEMMKLYLECEDAQAYFIIDSEPVIKGDGYQETKTVTAHSIECELSDMYLKSLKINCGTSDSQEYLATDNNGDFYNINPYTGLPYEYISLINYNDTQLSLLHLVLQNTGWTVKEGIGTLYLDNDDYFKIILTTVSDPSGSLERAVGCVKKRWSEANGVYAIELQKWDSAAIEFTTKDITDITIAAQGTDTISSATEDTFAYSPIALKDANGNIISNEDGITRVYGNTEDEKGITINYRGLKPGTYKITSPYDAALNRGVQIKSIIVAEQNAAETKKIQHIFKASDLTSAKDNEEITGLCQMKGSFDTSDSVYSFLMKTVSPAASVIFEFDRKHKTVGVVKATDYGKDTGVFITMRNLMNSFEVTSSSQDSIMTKLTPAGADDLGIEYVNFGKDYILNLDYFMNELNEYGDYKFVSSDLHDKYNIWKNYRETDTVTYNGNTYTRRELYRELTRQYNQSVLDISELKSRVPNDGCCIDYTTYSLEELKTSLTAYKQALTALITLYKNEYGVTALGNAPDYSPTPSDGVNIMDTPYWYDFYAYQESIIPQVEEALKMYCQTDENGNLVVGENGDYIELDTGNADYYADTSIVKTVDSYLYEWSLYGLDELETKKKAWSEAANILYDECFILSGTASAPEKYRTADSSGWDSLTSDQKASFASQSAYISQLKSYLDYMSFDERANSLTGTTCKGIIRQCDDAITGRTNEIAEIEAVQTIIDAERSELARSVLPENITIDGEKLFSGDDLAVITSLMRETDYTNENILITNLDDIVSEVDAQEELYQAATEELYKLSQPQYSFSTDIDNLFSLDEFKLYQEPFDVGNFIRVGIETHEEKFDCNFVKLRLISVSYNPLETSENLSVEFSTMAKSLSGISDLTFLLDESNSSTGASSSGSSSSSGGTYGNNDANVQISNNMLNALLSTDLFGTAVTDVILDSIQANKGNFNTLFSRSGVFDSLEAGLLKVSGDCITDRIKSWNWNGTDSNLLNNTEGSIIDLSNGKFNFAGGKLKWDGETLSIKGNGEFTGIINAQNSIISESQIVNGDITANSLTATTGAIGGWNFNETAFYINSSIIGNKYGKYFGDNGLSIDERFILNSDGFYIRSQKVEMDDMNNTHFVLSDSPDVYNEFDVINVTSDSKHLNEPNIALTVYLYGQEDFEDEQTFSLFIVANIGCTIWTSDLPEADHVNTTATYQYRFRKSDIVTSKNTTVSTVFENYLVPWKIGCVNFSDIESVTNNLENILLNDYPYHIVSYRINTISVTNIHTTKPNVVLEDDEWDENYEVINMIAVEYKSSDETKCQYMSPNTSSVMAAMILDSYNKKIKIGTTEMNNTGFSSKYTYDNVSVTGSELYISSDGTIGLSGSSERFKNSISTTLNDVSNPHGLYDIDVVQYKYNDDYFSSKSDSGIGKYFIGFIAENVAEKFKDGATFDNQGLVSGWSIRYMFPAALKLIQEQHKDIEELKDEIEKLKQNSD